MAAKRQVFSSSDTKRISKAVRGAENPSLDSGGGLNVGRVPTGDRWFTAKIVDAGPSNAADFLTDNRYWFKRCALVADGAGPSAKLEYKPLPTASPHYTHAVATNLAEAKDTHYLMPDRIVRVFWEYDTNGTVRYQMDELPNLNVSVSISGDASGGGKYLGTILTGKSTLTASGTLALATGLTATATAYTAALFCNELEQGKSTHDLETGKVYRGLIIGMQSDGRKIVQGSAITIVDCGSSGGFGV